MAYAGSNTGPARRGSAGEPSGKGLAGSSQYSSKAGSAGCKGEPTSSMPGAGKGMTTKGNGKKL